MALVYFEKFTDILAHMRVLEADQVSTRRILNYAYTTFSYRDKSREFTWAAKHGYDDCRVEFYNRRNDTIPVGMIPRLTGYLKEQYPDISVRISPEIRQMFTPPFDKVTREALEAYVDGMDLHNRHDGTKLTPYDHQYRLAMLALTRRRCSLLACTSAGKSLSMMIICRYLMEKENKKVLVIVPSTNLVEQLYSDFHDDYGWDESDKHCTLIHSTSKDKLSKKDLEKLESLNLGEESTLKDITISTWQSLQQKGDDFFKVFDAVLVDEAHSARGTVLRDILGKCINANNFKVGVSGTLPDVNTDSDDEDCIDAGYIEGNLGPKIDVVHLKELKALGILTSVEVRAIFIPYPPAVRPTICSSKCKFQDELDLMVNNGSRKDVMDMLIESGKISLEHNTVMLYKGKENLHIMHDYLSEKHPEFTYHVIEGEKSTVERETIRKTLEKGTGNIIIATYGCMKQGVNIKLLHNLVFAEPGKSAYMIMQSVGRVVRKHPNKSIAYVYDLVDDASYYTNPRRGGPPRRMLNYMMQHYYKRVGYYAKEDIPIEEVHLDGIFEAKLQPDDIRKKKDEAVAEAEGKKSRARKAPAKKPYSPRFSR